MCEHWEVYFWREGQTDGNKHRYESQNSSLDLAQRNKNLHTLTSLISVQLLIICT